MATTYTYEFTSKSYFAGINRLRWITIILMGGVPTLMYYIGYSHGGVVPNKIDFFTQFTFGFAALMIIGTVVLKAYWKRRIEKIGTLDEKLASVQMYIVLNYALISAPILLGSQMFVPSHSGYLPIISSVFWTFLLPTKEKTVGHFLTKDEKNEMQTRSGFKVIRKR